MTGTGGAVRAADEVRGAVRALMSALAPGGLRGPVDVYDVLGPLADAAAVLGEVTERLAGFLDAELQADRIGVDLPMSGPARLPDPLASVTTATAALDQARRHADRLAAAALDAAHETTSRLHRRE